MNVYIILDNVLENETTEGKKKSPGLRIIILKDL